MKLFGWMCAGLLLLFPASRVLSEPTITLAAVGDIMLARGVTQQIERHGPGYPFAHTASTLRTADITFGNLECVLSTQPTQPNRAVTLRAAPSYAAILADAGFDVLSLANNHALDCGAAGLQDTRSTLRQHKIGFCGAGSTPRAATAPFVITKNGIRVAFVEFTQFGGGSLAQAKDADVRGAVSSARSQADVVVASFHWGIENEARPSTRQKHLARVAAQAGADLILGHHPHVLQGWEWLPSTNKRRALAVYSLGNFVFDQRGLRRDETIILQCRLGKSGLLSAAAMPVKIKHGQPRPMAGEAAESLRQHLKQLSLELGA